MKSKLYSYINNQYVLNKFTNEDLVVLVSLGRISDVERLEIADPLT
ncbi:hypothetical protein 8F11_76 [uncultured Caudovirales phage]|uniref:Uncharacterized protein n=1 Tax=uncultured Caudovirales phage TaxID=2100421 RepID=A0A2H4J7Q7_9CAUD|nr:hypothetical protein 8F11_76 [uncultured Caudovirales phage]